VRGLVLFLGWSNNEPRTGIYVKSLVWSPLLCELASEHCSELSAARGNHSKGGWKKGGIRRAKTLRALQCWRCLHKESFSTPRALLSRAGGSSLKPDKKREVCMLEYSIACVSTSLHSIIDSLRQGWLRE
jgi:hypothetical protein